MGQDLLQDGIAAFKAGDRDKARQLFLLVTETDNRNERAWYYLAVLEPDPALRREYLERVVAINPENEKAREVLDRLKARETVPAEEPAHAAAASPAARPTAAPKGSRIRPLNVSGDIPGAANEDGFALPVKIPGAPTRVSPESLGRDGVKLLREAFRTFGRASGVTLFTSELGKATWWRFWLLSGVAALVCAGIAFFTALIFVLRFPQALNSIVGMLLTPLLSIPIILAMEYAGVYASFRWAERNSGGGSLVRHAYGVALRWTPMLIVYAVINLTLLILGALGSGIGLSLFILMAFITVAQLAASMEKVHAFIDPRQQWFTAGIMFAGALVAGVILGIVFGAVIFPLAIPFLIG